MKRLLSICFILLSSSLLYAEQISTENASSLQNKIRAGIVIQQTTLTETPSTKSPSIGVLKKNQNVTVFKRERAWYQVSTEQDILGWINMLNIRFVNVAKREGELGISSLFDSAKNNTLPTVSTGIRGFDEEDLKKASPDMAQVEWLNHYAISIPQAKAFAEEGLLIEKPITIIDQEAK